MKRVFKRVIGAITHVMAYHIIKEKKTPDIRVNMRTIGAGQSPDKDAKWLKCSI